jgi:hypothetical protein
MKKASAIVAASTWPPANTASELFVRDNLSGRVGSVTAPKWGDALFADTRTMVLARYIQPICGYNVRPYPTALIKVVRPFSYTLSVMRLTICDKILIR